MRKIKKYLSPSGNLPVWQTPVGEDWQKEWKFRLTPASRSKVAGGWSSKGKKKKASESGELYTKRRIKEETKRTWRSDAADIAHGIGEGVLALHPYTAIPYYGAKVGQDFLNGNLNWGTALNASIPLFHLSPQAVGLREATNVALEDAANAGSKTARNWRVAREINLVTRNNKPNIEVPNSLIRTKIGDVEIDNPLLYYRLGSKKMGDDFSRTGIVSTDNEGFVNPMFAQGRLWYGVPTLKMLKLGTGVLVKTSSGRTINLFKRNEESPKTDLLISNAEMVPANLRSTPLKWVTTIDGTTSVLNWGGRRVPQTMATKDNTVRYVFNPNYGYKQIVQEPSTSLKFFERRPSKINEVERLENVKIPTITTENAASITPEQWTATQDAAIARGDMVEAQRLRDLHFKVTAPDADVPDIYHGTHYENIGNSISIGSAFRDNLNPNVNFYTTPSKQYARQYGSNIYKFKVNAKTKDLKEGRFAYLPKHRVEELKAAGYKGTVDYESGPSLGAGSDAYEYTFFDPKQYKLADAVTYDDKGIRIPLGERDNFNINDIRYGLLPFGIGLTGYGLYKRKLGGKMNILLFLKNGSGIHIKKKNRGKFTDYCGGEVTQECINKGKHSSNPAIRKRATFADNVRKWKHKNGGKAFVEGVNVLDSNPNAYKYVKKKYKMRMALNGTKFDWTSTLGNVGSSILQGYFLNKKISEEAKAAKAENKLTSLDFFNIYNLKLQEAKQLEELLAKAIEAMTGTTINSSDIVAASNAYKNASGEYAALKNNVDLQNRAIDAQAQALKSNIWGNAISGVMQQGMGILNNYLGNKSSNNTTSFKISLPNRIDFGNTKTNFGSLGTYSVNSGYLPNKLSFDWSKVGIQ